MPEPLSILTGLGAISADLLKEKARGTVPNLITKEVIG